MGCTLVALSGCGRSSSTQSVTVPADASPPPVAVSVKPPPIAAENLGTAHPLIVEAVAPDGHWAVLCQARRDTDGNGTIQISRGLHGEMYGDELEPYLVLGGGSGDRLDAFAGADPTGRYVVVGRGGKLVLFDTFAARETELLHGLLDDGSSSFASRASISFDERGRRLVYLRGSAHRPEVVVRELASGIESVISYGSGELARARLDEGGELVWLDVVVADTNDSGAIELPRARTSLASRRCRGRPSVYGSYGFDGDQPTRHVARQVDGWRVADAATALGAFGQRVVLRRDDAIVLRDGAEEKTLIPAECKAQIVQADTARERLFFGCLAHDRQDASVRPIRYIRAGIERIDADGTRHALGFDLDVLAPYGETWSRGRHLLYDTSTGTMGKGPEGYAVVDVGDRALYSRGMGDERVVTLCDAKGKRRRFPYLLQSPSPEFAVQGQRVAIEVDRKTAPAPSVVFDMERAETIGTFVGRPLALAKSGHVLVPIAEDEARLGGGILTGPVHWIQPGAVSR